MSLNKPNYCAVMFTVETSCTCGIPAFRDSLNIYVCFSYLFFLVLYVVVQVQNGNHCAKMCSTQSVLERVLNVLLSRCEESYITEA